MIDEILPNRVISIIGSGGKTTLMYALAKKLASLQKKVIITTSTKIFVPKDYPYVLIPNISNLDKVNKNDIFSEISSVLNKNSICCTGILYTEKLTPDQYKLSSFTNSGINANELLKRCNADYILIEADGSKHMPLKFPSINEPVIVPESDMVIGVVGLWCIGKPLKDVCHRFELACIFLSDLYGIKIQPEHIVTMCDVKAIVNSDLGYKKNVGHRVFKLIEFENPPVYSNFKL